MTEYFIELRSIESFCLVSERKLLEALIEDLVSPEFCISKVTFNEIHCWSIQTTDYETTGNRSLRIHKHTEAKVRRIHYSQNNFRLQTAD